MEVEIKKFIILSALVTVFLIFAIIFILFKPYHEGSFNKKRFPVKGYELGPEKDIYEQANETEADEYSYSEELKEKSGYDKNRANVSIIIDDLGWDLDIARLFIGMDIPISFAILPNRPYSEKIAEEAHNMNKEVLLHQPMEPHGYPYVRPGNDVLLHDMTKKEIIEVLDKNLKSMPYLVGVNNHMGSLLTENIDVMDIVTGYIKKQNLFFVDSLTSSSSVAFSMAKRNNVRTAKRDVFLDNTEDVEYIEGQLEKLYSLAKKEGKAIGIGHPYMKTLVAIKNKIDELNREPIDIVPVSALVE